jgi:tetratricopeptide (TPR) repeat protein
MGKHVRRTPLAAPQVKNTGAPSDLSARRRRFNVRTFIPLFLIGAGLYAYHNSFDGAFVFDDFSNIVDNPWIRRLWPPWDIIVHAQVRPLWQLSLAANYAIGGLNVRGYHAFNLAVHILAGLVLFGIVRRTLESEQLRARYGRPAYWLATAVAAIWMVHPLQTGSVTYVCQRAESLMGLLFLLTLYCGIRSYQSPHRQKWSVAAITASALGMATKEVMVVAPIVVLLYDRVFLAKSFKEAVRQRWMLYVGLAVTWAVLGVELARLSLGPSADIGGDIERVTAWEYLRTQPGVIVHYLRLSLWPHPLILDYKWQVASTTISVAPWAAVVLVLLAGTVLAFRRRPWLGFLGAWFFLILSPTSSILPIADLAFEHRMYLPLAAVVMLAVIAGHEVLGAFLSRLAAPDHLRRWLGGGLVVTAVVLLGFATVRRNDDYRSGFLIWSDTVAKRPNNPRAHNNLGQQLAGQGKVEDAVAHYSEALRLNPHFLEAYSSLGSLYMEQGRYREAAPFYQRELAIVEGALGPDHIRMALPLGGLAALYNAQERYREAEPLYRRALAIQERALGPDHPTLALAGTLNDLGDLYRVQGRYVDAEPLLLRSIAIREALMGPRHPDVGITLGNLGLVYFEQGRYPLAEDAYKRSLAILDSDPGKETPGVTESLNNLAELYRVQGRYAEAEPLYRRSLSIRERTLGPEHPSVAASLNNLAALYHLQGRYVEAEPLYRRTLVILEKSVGPEHQRVGITLNNLAEVYRAEGRWGEAAAIYPRAIVIVEKSLGPDHPTLARLLENYAGVLRRARRDAEALQADARARDIRARHAQQNQRR